MLAISYPILKQKDLEWIQAIRREHDELQYEVVMPHFTLIFETDKLDRHDFIDHVSPVVRCVPPIDFQLCKATTVKNRLSDYTYTFLVPEEGYNSILNLHNSLYGGELSDDQLPDTPYIPHITIGNSLERQTCIDLADSFNAKSLSIHGHIRDIDIVVWRNCHIETIDKIELADKRNVDMD